MAVFSSGAAPILLLAIRSRPICRGVLFLFFRCLANLSAIGIIFGMGSDDNIRRKTTPGISRSPFSRTRLISHVPFYCVRDRRGQTRVSVRTCHYSRIAIPIL